MKFKFPQPNSSEITPLKQLINRRKFLANSGVLLAAGTTTQLIHPCEDLSAIQLDLPITQKKLATRYNNYYEFSTDKKAVSILAQELTLSPWSVKVSGLVETPKTFDIDQLNAICNLERIYRFRCVEGWSMVVPWSGLPFRLLADKCKPLSSAKYVEFISCLRPSEMIGQRHGALEWPYTEALRIDEALHPLTILATGFYGVNLSAQNGAPVRLVVPWKYGFKSAKAITEIRFVETLPSTTWVKANPHEYGFYANVNPVVAHPRWGQSREVPLGQIKKVKTLMFNGYQEQVASLYSGMDLKVHF